MLRRSRTVAGLLAAFAAGLLLALGGCGDDSEDDSPATIPDPSQLTTATTNATTLDRTTTDDDTSTNGTTTDGTTTDDSETTETDGEDDSGYGS